MPENRPGTNQTSAPPKPIKQAPIKQATTQKIAEGLWLIPLNLNQKGFSSFISSWLYQGDKTVLIDIGPAATVPHLLNALSELGVKKLDAVLLTHIHLDHAGGAGEFARHFPDVPIICHESATRHLASPEKLWEGSLSVLGHIARAYGPMIPVPENQLISATEFGEKEIRVIKTPGHAPHHLSFLAGPYLFGGEAGGVFIDLGHAQWLRPGTPHRFFLETAIESIEMLKTIDHELFCYCHFGWTKNAAHLLDQHKRQLFFWSDVIAEEIKKAEIKKVEIKKSGTKRAEIKKAEMGTEEISADQSADQSAQERLVSRCLNALLDRDPCLSAWGDLPPDIREREGFFMKNSVRGFIGYHKEKEKTN